MFFFYHQLFSLNVVWVGSLVSPESQELTASICLCCSPPHFLRQGFPLNPELAGLANSSQWVTRISLPVFLSTVVIVCGFYRVLGISSSLLLSYPVLCTTIPGICPGDTSGTLLLSVCDHRSPQTLPSVKATTTV